MSFSIEKRISAFSLLLFCVSLILISYTSSHPAIARTGFRVVSGVLGPLQSVSHGLRMGVVGIWENYIDLLQVREENKELSKHIQGLERENSQLLEVASENQRLRELLQLKKSFELDGVAANVIGFDPSNWVQAIVLDRGKEAGIYEGFPVVSGGGVVGQVVAVGSSSARVLLLVDHSSGIDGILQRNRVRGIVAGAGGEMLYWKFVLRANDVQQGDRVVTSGMGGVFPKGLLLGTISSVKDPTSGLFQRVNIEPAVDISRLESVFVIFRQNENRKKGE